MVSNEVAQSPFQEARTMATDANRRLINDELTHIPEWPGKHQWVLRLCYNTFRESSLGKNVDRRQTRGEVLLECIAHVRKTDPAAEVYFDKDFFGVDPE
jgi:hypothetical protein